MYTLTVLGVLPANFVANVRFQLRQLPALAAAISYVAPTPNALTPEGLVHRNYQTSI